MRSSKSLEKRRNMQNVKRKQKRVNFCWLQCFACTTVSDNISIYRICILLAWTCIETPKQKYQHDSSLTWLGTSTKNKRYSTHGDPIWMLCEHTSTFKTSQHGLCIYIYMYINALLLFTIDHAQLQPQIPATKAMTVLCGMVLMLFCSIFSVIAWDSKNALQHIMHHSIHR